MTTDKKPQDIAGLSGEFLTATLNEAESRFGQDTGGQRAFILGCAYAFGYYKEEIEAFQAVQSERDALAESLALAVGALEKISADKNQTIASRDQEFMDGAYTAFGRSAEIADEALAEIKARQK